ncbi:hypothetical protein ACIRRA_33590 [Nocardia sp. NPDC101769]|uniref:hypothetical protein n=1 Tax=Nocardia sp. NPDC101769 TaxID=3364333 RepID=UPI003819C92F
MKRIVGIIAAVATVALATACQDGGSTPATGGSSMPSSATVTAPGTVVSPGPQRSPGATQPAGDGAPTTAGNGKCVDLAADGGWKPVNFGSALHCTEIGVPADVAGQICR